MRDELFLRGKVPMTKSEVRAVVLSKLELSGDSVLYDVGAGTGSVSIEAASQLSSGTVYGVEQKEEALFLIEKNKERFHADNLVVVRGLAPESLKPLPPPTHVFVGGSLGNLRDILELVLCKNEEVRVVLTAITIETLSQALAWLKERKIQGEIVQLCVSRADCVGGYHMMRGENPVYVISFGGKSFGDNSFGGKSFGGKSFGGNSFGSNSSAGNSFGGKDTGNETELS